MAGLCAIRLRTRKARICNPTWADDDDDDSSLQAPGWGGGGRPTAAIAIHHPFHPNPIAMARM